MTLILLKGQNSDNEQYVDIDTGLLYNISWVSKKASIKSGTEIYQVGDFDYLVGTLKLDKP